MISEIFQSFPMVPFIIIVITLVLYKLKHSSRAEVFLSKIPGPLYPLIGSAWDLNLPNDVLTEVAFSYRRIYGERFRIKLGPVNFIFLANPDDVEKLLTSSKHTEKGIMYSFLMPWLGTGLLTSKGERWHSRRKLLTPSFHFKILEDFVVIFNEQSKILVDILREDFKDHEERDICKYLTTCALDIIGEAAMDIKFNSQRNQDIPYVKSVYKACEVVQYQILRPHLWLNFIFKLTRAGREYTTAIKILHDFTTEVIKARKSAPAIMNKEADKNTNNDDIYWHGKRRLAFLDLLIEAQKNPENNLSDTDIREEVDTFMFEGHDTTSASLFWTTFLLGCNPIHQ
ncbi:unnamed protein product, partial [Allacma fusca]